MTVRVKTSDDVTATEIEAGGASQEEIIAEEEMTAAEEAEDDTEAVSVTPTSY